MKNYCIMLDGVPTCTAVHMGMVAKCEHGSIGAGSATCEYFDEYDCECNSRAALEMADMFVKEAPK